MTFSIIGRCETSGMFGVAITTSSICVGARCPHVRAKVGAVSTQNITDPYLGFLLLNMIEAGHSAQTALDEICSDRANIEFRQLTVIDHSGQIAHFTGNKILGTNSVVQGQNSVAAGNLLKHSDLPQIMIDSFENAPTNTHLAERLLTALEAGLKSGGEEGPVHSAALLVSHEQSFPLVDLRLDWSDDCPVTQLRSLWQDYEPQMQAYLDRALNPAMAPRYGVAGDL